MEAHHLAKRPHLSTSCLLLPPTFPIPHGEPLSLSCPRILLSLSRRKRLLDAGQSHPPSCPTLARFHVVSIAISHVMDARMSSASASSGERCALVLPPRGRTRAVAHFAGGAFVGAAPAEAYGPLLRRLADAGVASVASPYAVSFDHAARASKLRATTSRAHREAVSAGTWSAAAPAFALGHSNGALLHALAACEVDAYAPPLQGHVLLSFNSRPLDEAVPVPGFMDAAPGFVRAALEATNVSLERDTPLPFAQLESVARELAQGGAQFTPTPQECRRILRTRFPEDARALLVQFEDDAIDQTDELAMLLRTRCAPDRVQVKRMRGNHLTPIAQEALWKAGPSFTPMDAFAQVAQTAALADLRNLADELIVWVERYIL